MMEPVGPLAPFEADKRATNASTLYGAAPIRGLTRHPKLGLDSRPPRLERIHYCHSPQTMFTKQVSRPVDGMDPPSWPPRPSRVERTRKKTRSRARSRFLCPTASRQTHGAPVDERREPHPHRHRLQPRGCTAWREPRPTGLCAGGWRPPPGDGMRSVHASSSCDCRSTPSILGAAFASVKPPSRL
jgi:hypothetical protein